MHDPQPPQQQPRYTPQPPQGQRGPGVHPWQPQRPGQVQPWQQPYPPNPYPRQVAPKSVLGAVAISFFVPGSGAIYAGEKAWGIVVLLMWLVSIPLCLVTIGFFTGFICWVAGMISGGMAAQAWNRQHGIIS